MKRFKQIDPWISAVLIVAGSITWLMVWRDLPIVALFVVGGWQLLSVFIHLISGWGSRRSRLRHIYHWCLVILIGVGLTSFIWPEMLMLLFFGLLFVGPALAVFYTIIGFWENHRFAQLNPTTPNASIK